MKKELTGWVDNVIESANRPKFTQENLEKGLIGTNDKEMEKDWEKMYPKGTIVALTGGKGSGKDTAAEIFVERGFKRLAFADEMRDALYVINPIVLPQLENNRLQDIVDQRGWDTAKRTVPEIRRLMQQYGERIKVPFGRDCWTNVIKKTLQSEPFTNWVVSDLRFAEERDMIHSLGGTTIRINRTGFEPEGEHISEQHLEGIMYDWYNDSDVDNLRMCVHNFLKSIDSTAK